MNRLAWNRFASPRASARGRTRQWSWRAKRQAFCPPLTAGVRGAADKAAHL